MEFNSVVADAQIKNVDFLGGGVLHMQMQCKWLVCYGAEYNSGDTENIKSSFSGL